MHKQSALIIAFAFALSGCGSTGDHRITNKASEWMRYVCSDGNLVQAKYPDAQTAIVQFHDGTHILHVAISGSGARYIGDGWQWWTKGMHEGMLAPLATGENIASAPGVDCRAD